MEKRGINIVRVLITFVLIVIVIHLIGHFSIYGTGLPFLAQEGISGLSIGPINLDDNNLQTFKNNSQYQVLSKYAVLGEWGLLMVLIIFSFAKERINVKKEVIDLSAARKYKKSENHTDLDTLYEMLKDKKSLRLSTISKLFEVDKDLVMEWVATLESGNLASISYPRFGEPEVKVIER